MAELATAGVASTVLLHSALFPAGSLSACSQGLNDSQSSAGASTARACQQPTRSAAPGHVQLCDLVDCVQLKGAQQGV